MCDNFVFMKNLKEICLESKGENKIDNDIKDDGCSSIFKNAKHLSNLVKLNISCNKEFN